MANEYAALSDLTTYMGIGDLDDNASLADVVEDAARAIDAYCGRRFYLDGTASARVYEPKGGYTLRVDDIGDITGLLVKADYDGDGTFETTFSAAQYELGPLSGGTDGIEGYPYTEVRLISTSWPWPAAPLRRGRAQITARWGWAAVPRPVYRAALIVGAELFRRKDAPLGVSGGADFGQIRLGNDSMRQVQSLLGPYRSGRRLGSMA
jgi:hypothetical protein